MESSARTVELAFREYRAEDHDGCIDVFNSNIPEFFSEEERTYFVEFLERLPGRYGVVVDGTGRVVGCGGIAVSRTDPHGGDLTWGMVHRSLHKMGIGRMLTRERIAWVDALPDIHVLYLNTSHLTEAFYEKFGFRTITRIPNGYREGLHRCDMEWRRNGAV